MKVKCDLIVDTETKSYELRFSNLTSPGESVEYSELIKLLPEIFKDVNNQIDNPTEPDERVTKMVH